jgi:molybdopterin synthase sulfur carrier subunit
MKSVKVQYFALFREKAGVDEQLLSSSSGTLRELYAEVSKLNGFDLPVEMIQVAVNDEFSRLDQALNEGDRIVFIPPVAGG